MKAMIEKKKVDITIEKLETLLTASQEEKGNAKPTISYYQRTFLKVYKFFGDRQSVSRLAEEGIDGKWKAWLASQDINDQTIASYMRGWRVIVYFAADKGYIPARKITIKELEIPIHDCYTDRELDKLLVKPNPDNFTEYRNWVIINYLLATANRVASIVALNVEDIDTESGYIDVLRQKNKTPIVIPAIKKLLPILKEYIAYYRTNEDGTPMYDSQLFCNRYGEKLTEGGLKKTIAEYNRSRGVDKTSIHLFRHSFAKRWIMANGDLTSLQRILGQKSLKMVMHYANLYAPDLKEKAEKYAALANTRIKSGKTLQRRIV